MGVVSPAGMGVAGSGVAPVVAGLEESETGVGAGYRLWLLGSAGSSRLLSMGPFDSTSDLTGTVK